MKKLSGKQQAEAALKELREIEKARLKLGAEQGVMPGFADMAVNAVWLISDLAGDAIRRVEAAEREHRG